MKILFSFLIFFRLCCENIWANPELKAWMKAHQSFELQKKLDPEKIPPESLLKSRVEKWKLQPQYHDTLRLLTAIWTQQDAIINYYLARGCHHRDQLHCLTLRQMESGFKPFGEQPIGLNPAENVPEESYFTLDHPDSFLEPF